MTKPVILFSGDNATGTFGLWVTDGTAANTYELPVSGAAPTGLRPAHLTVFGNKVLFAGRSPDGVRGPTYGYYDLWVTDGTGPGTSALTISGAYGPGVMANDLTVLGNKVLFQGRDTPGHEGLWVTDGTGSGTSELAISGTYSFGVYPNFITALGTKALFSGIDSSKHHGLWVTDGTGPGTSELTVAGAGASGLYPSGLLSFGGKLLFNGLDASGHNELWLTDGTGGGTTKLTVPGEALTGLNPSSMTVFGNEVLFAGYDSNARTGLWVTDGTSAGTYELTVAGASPTGVSPAFITVFGNKAVFNGHDSYGYHSLWVTDGTSVGTSRVAIGAVAASNGLNPRDFSALGNKVLFAGTDASFHRNLWVTDGSVAGTIELPVAGAAASGLAPTSLVQFTACFAKGTQIETTRGPVAVESLSIGDTVVIHDGGRGEGRRTRRIEWIGRRGIDCTSHPRPGDVLPVRVRAGAFGDELPRNDLYLSPDHAIYAEGVLIPVKHLINRDTVAQVAAEAVIYYHVELSGHDVILAEGLPVESYLDTGDRDNFDNGGTTTRLFADFSGGSRTRLLWEALGCAPLRVVGPEVEVVRDLLRERTAALSVPGRGRRANFG